jgi:serine/threonine protein kinase
VCSLKTEYSSQSGVARTGAYNSPKNMALQPGTRLGAYEILGLVGTGGMGEVYRARDARLGRDVAVKVLPASYAEDPDRLHRFEKEARAAGALNHPNILVVYDVGSHEAAPYVVFELLEGASLRERMAGTALPIRKAPTTRRRSPMVSLPHTTKASCTVI